MGESCDEIERPREQIGVIRNQHFVAVALKGAANHFTFGLQHNRTAQWHVYPITLHQRARPFVHAEQIFHPQKYGGRTFVLVAFDFRKEGSGWQHQRRRPHRINAAEILQQPLPTRDVPFLKFRIEKALLPPHNANMR